MLTAALGAFVSGCSGGGDDAATERSGEYTAVSPSDQQASGTVEDGSLPTRVPPGLWSGEQLILTVTPTGATVEFECGAGRLDEPLILDDRGSFVLRGSYAAQSGGPASATQTTTPALSARYRGHLTDPSHLVLTVELPASDTSQGPFELELGGEDSLQRCG